MGNICRSPTAEGVMRHLLAERGLDGEIEVQSAGTGGWHAGSPPDARATHAARGSGREGEREARGGGPGGWHAGSPPDARATQAARARGIALEGAAQQVTR